MANAVVFETASKARGGHRGLFPSDTDGDCRSTLFWLMHVIWAITLTLLVSFFGQTAAAAIVGAAFVQEDGSLEVKGRRIQLFGIYIPPTDRSCQTLFRPVRCSSRAALALDFKIQGFVHCEVKAKHRDSSLIARCYVDRNAFSEGDDLSAYLISLGWAAALPDAPYEYHVMEKIARQRGLGVWGFPVDSIQ